MVYPPPGTGDSDGYEQPTNGTYTYTVTSPNSATISFPQPYGDPPGNMGLIFSSPTQGTLAGYNYSIPFSLLPTGGQPGTRALTNMSVRLNAIQGQQVILGFVVGDGAPLREILIRAVGPSLAAFGVNNVAANPIYQLNQSFLYPYPESGANELGWSASVIGPEAARAGAFPLLSGSNDKADIYLLPPGSYTITVNPTNAAQAGNQLIEVYEVE